HSGSRKGTDNASITSRALMGSKGHINSPDAARHVQRSIVKQLSPAIPAPQNPTIPDDEDPDDVVRAHYPTLEAAGYTEVRHPTIEQPNPRHQPTSHQNPNESNQVSGVKELMVEIRDTLKNVNQVLIGSQNSLARGFNSSLYHWTNVPEAYNLPTFKYERDRDGVSFSINTLSENVLSQYLRFYGIGEELIEEGEELKIKSGMIDDARRLLSGRLFLNR
ncbi:hypothetical protein FRC11_000323, partial [Ceratobasidium sp. 423]